ncbi:thiol-disulfide isomerase/thioredoxin [Allocatelliglobosispora scoriae]|uniref:Thiol-disulfide isomerase/thioredoxin n=1 Tax=Allocatelliglobosispora scoriae TaxID=643052 RepID=A0A841BIJ0_9ACTN|nr:thioredoxin family protein [Allocatelliglobosispora scoriae]MBB5867006.1 thiol-disulfide isomerase/thioredoxin [Allocatelliglobosispora scoriae]
MLPGLLTVIAALAVASVAGVVWQRRNGTFRSTRAADSLPVADGPAVLTESSVDAAPAWPDVWQRLGLVPGTPVTLVQFSSAFCAPCRATRALCTDVAAAIPGVAHVEVDAESHLAEVRELDIWKTPTLLLIDGQGRERLRASGLPTRSQLVVAIGTVLAPDADAAVA